MTENINYRPQRIPQSVEGKSVDYKPYTRRDFLKFLGLLGGAGATAAVGSACGVRIDSTPMPEDETIDEEHQFEPSSSPSRLEKIETPVGGYPISINPEKEVKFPNSPRWFPDTRTSWLRTQDGRLLVFASAGVDSVRMEGRSWTDLKPAEVVLTADKTESQAGYNGYRGFSTVFDREDGSLVAVLHKENWKSEGEHFPFTASIEIATSDDEGRTWSKPQVVLTGNNMFEGLNDVQGVGQPGGIVTNGEKLVVYYTDWQGPDNIHMAYAPVNRAEDPDAWKKWVEGEGFVEPGIGGDSTPVITSNESYVALPQILWDQNRSTFLMLNEQDKGFAVRTSRNGINWSEGQMFAGVPSPLSTRRIEQEWYSYPTLIGLDAPNQFNIGKNNMLLTSRGVWSITAHRGVLIPVEIK